MLLDASNSFRSPNIVRDPVDVTIEPVGSPNTTSPILEFTEKTCVYSDISAINLGDISIKSTEPPGLLILVTLSLIPDMSIPFLSAFSSPVA